MARAPRQINWLIEPETGTRYVRDQVPYFHFGDLSEYNLIGEFTPPATWKDLGPSIANFRNDTRWDEAMRKMYGAEYENNMVHRPDYPVDIHAQAVILAKSYGRKVGHYHDHGNEKVVFWAWFTRIEPCWYFFGRGQSYKMYSQIEVDALARGKFAAPTDDPRLTPTPTPVQTPTQAQKEGGEPWDR